MPEPRDVVSVRVGARAEGAPASAEAAGATMPLRRVLRACLQALADAIHWRRRGNRQN
jgi:hypothetical protein